MANIHLCKKKLFVPLKIRIKQILFAKKLQEISKFVDSNRREIDTNLYAYRASLPQVVYPERPNNLYKSSIKDYSKILKDWEEQNKDLIKEYLKSMNEVNDKFVIRQDSLWQETFNSKPEYKEYFKYYNFIEQYYSSPYFYVVETELK